ncbi:MAG: hypothetical protein J2P50_08030 [Hyphomicrobiaceae bacterium]|nr:hypothetical protein [Hyphomicrobiaceae bacterium]
MPPANIASLEGLVLCLPARVDELCDQNKTRIEQIGTRLARIAKLEGLEPKRGPGERRMCSSFSWRACGWHAR